jgi:hypothetical protein
VLALPVLTKKGMEKLYVSNHSVIAFSTRSNFILAAQRRCVGADFATLYVGHRRKTPKSRQR